MERVGTFTRRVGLALLVVTLVATGCGGSDDDGGGAGGSGSGGESAADPTSGECTEERVGGQVTMGTLTHTAGLDPVVSRGTGTAGGIEAIALYDTLVRYDVESDDYVPQVAESLESNADFTEWTLTLPEGAVFGNGDPLTAEAVRTSFARHQDPAHQSTQFLASQVVTEMEAVDERTLVFRLDGPWARFPFLLANLPGMVTNPAVVDERGDDFNTDPTGAGVGPYEVERYVPGDELVLRAKDDWWGGPVCIEELRFITVPGAEGTYDAFQAGEIQAAFLRDPTVVAQAREDGVAAFSTIQGAGAIYMFNHETGPLADPVVREALTLAIDPEVINERAWEGQARTGTALIDEDSVLYDGQEGPQPDPERAAELVEEAKAGGWDGELTLLCPSEPGSEDVCLAFKAMADAAGMNVTLDSKRIDDIIQQVLYDRNFEVAQFGMNLPDADPWLRLSSFLGTGSFVNSGGYSDPDMDAAIEALRSAPDLAGRQEALADIQAVWNETFPNLSYAAVEEVVVLDDSLRGMQFSQDSQVYFGAAYLEE
jgi:peptide/nickel transport system substrate-binding protein